jgi:hypothetical protein
LKRLMHCGECNTAQVISILLQSVFNFVFLLTTLQTAQYCSKLCQVKYDVVRFRSNIHNPYLKTLLHSNCHLLGK